MRWLFLDPSRDEVAAVATDLIATFGAQARDEALYLSEVAEGLGARRSLRNRRLYRLAAQEIAMRFDAAAASHRSDSAFLTM
jgi:hypothetical protein